MLFTFRVKKNKEKLKHIWNAETISAYLCSEFIQKLSPSKWKNSSRKVGSTLYTFGDGI